MQYLTSNRKENGLNLGNLSPELSYLKCSVTDEMKANDAHLSSLRMALS